MVENDKRKQDYLRTRFPHAERVFNDMSEIGNIASTWDGSYHKVPQVGHPNLLKHGTCGYDF